VVAREAKDLIPETWDALAKASTFGPAALERRHDAAIMRTFGIALDVDALNALNWRLIEYLGKRFAISLLDPGIEYWSRQILARSVGDRESSTYKDRAEDLRQLKKDWTADLAAMFIDISPLLPLQPGTAGDVPRVAIAGELTNTVENPRTQGEQVVHTTANPYDIEPEFAPPETTTGA